MTPLRFDPLTLPLEGPQLVEASAGTGKTHAMTELYLRLLLEKELAVGDILAVTFTRAATEELKTRIRARIRSALEALATDALTEAPLLARLVDGGCSPDRLRSLLRSALWGFDEAAVFTIHGFCQRILGDYAFESGVAFEGALLENEARLRQTAAYDFWRRHLCTAEPEVVAYLLGPGGLTPDRFLDWAGKGLAQRALKVIPREEVGWGEALATFRAARARFCTAWEAQAAVVEALLLEADLKGNVYGTTETQGAAPSKRAQRIRALVEAVEGVTAAPEWALPLPQDFRLLTRSELDRNVRKHAHAPEHPVFGLADELAAAAADLGGRLERLQIQLRRIFLENVGRDIGLLKQRLGLRGFDDLLSQARAALEGPTGTALRQGVRQRYRAALVDEFQDTDPVQYAIFSDLFGRDAPLLLIGDPKQAIYGFRGADVYTYLAAARAVPRKYTLGVNYRSGSGLLAAVNALFGSHPQPFGATDIRYEAVAPAPNAADKDLVVEGAPEASALKVLLLGRPEGGAPPGRGMSKEQGRYLSVCRVRREMARLLALGRQGRARVGDAALTPGDLAVLVRTHREARLVKGALGEIGIHSLIYSSASVFDSDEAQEMEWVLRAVAEPARPDLVRGALLTRLWGGDGATLQHLLADEGAWEGVLEEFARYHEIWRRDGPGVMLARLMETHRTRARLLGAVDGERQVTNQLHLLEVLQREAQGRGLGVRELLQWLAGQRRPAGERLDEHQQRLESDADAVRIVTIHRSKGLEYPVVFLPFAWDDYSLPPNLRGRDDPLFHDPADGLQLTLDLGSPALGPHRDLAAAERQAEDLRLFYVALTRARSACYVVFGPVSGYQGSPLAYLLTPPDGAPGTPLLDRLVSLGESSGGALAVVPPGAGPGEAAPPPSAPLGDLAARSFHGSIARDWRVTSFSALAARPATDISDRPDYDALPEEAGPEVYGETAPPERGPEADILDFPRGEKAGRCLHALLEELDFGEGREQVVRALIDAHLAAFGFEARWQEAVYRMVIDVLNVPLAADLPDLRLALVSRTRRLNELEFDLPLKKLRAHEMERALGLDPGSEAAGRLLFSPVQGFLKGFIDLVFEWRGRFYLVDWKSNFLGLDPAAYAPAALAAVMVRERYRLQYHLYAVALDQYLRRRLAGYAYETHFGGVFYVFLRGVRQASGHARGIFHDRPSQGRMEALRELLLQQSASPGEGARGGASC